MLVQTRTVIGRLSRRAESRNTLLFGKTKKQDNMITPQKLYIALIKRPVGFLGEGGEDGGFHMDIISNRAKIG